MKINRKITVVVPGEELGKLIAAETAQTQSRVLTGLAKCQILTYVYQKQPIEDLAAQIPYETVLWFVRMYKELLQSGRLEKDLDKMIQANLRKNG